MQDGTHNDTYVSIVAALLCAVIGIMFVTTLDVAPTGVTLTDMGWTGALGAFVGVLVPRASLRLVSLAALAVLGFVGSPVAAALALAALLLTLSLVRTSGWSVSIIEVEATKRRAAALQTITPGALFASTMLLHDHGVPFVSAIFATGVWVMIAIGAWIRLSTQPRRFVAIAAGLSLLAAAGIIASAMMTVREVQDHAANAERELRIGMQAVRASDVETATQSIALAATYIEDARESFSSPFITVLKHAPLSGPNLRPLDAVLVSASNLARSGQEVAGAAPDFGQLINETGIAVDEVERLAAHLDDLVHSARDVRATLMQERSVWMAASLESRLDDAADRTAMLDDLSRIPLTQNVRGLLGAEGQRSYLLVLGNTAEARELGGFAGGTALLTIDDGAISLVRADRPGALNDSPADPRSFSNAPPQRFLEHRPWLFSQNYTAMIDFPVLAEALSDLYPSMGGEEIDGVAYIDPLALASVIGLVGEIHLADSNMTVNATNVAHLVNVGQYEMFEDKDQRDEFLSELIATTFHEVVGAGAELEVDKFPALLQSIREDRLLFAPLDEQEFSIANALGLTGALPEINGQDYLAVSHLNGGPNKLDAYLRRSVSYEAKVDPVTGQLDAVLTVTLHNEAPLGLSTYAAGNKHDYPVGTNRAFVVVHTPHDAVEWTGGDEHELTRSWTEFGLQRHEQVVNVPRGESRTVTLRLRGSIAPGDYHLSIGHQPLVHDDVLAIAVEPASGQYNGPAASTSSEGNGLDAELRLQRDIEFAARWAPSIEPIARHAGRE